MKILSILMLTCLFIDTIARDELPDLVTDRPDQTESSTVVPLHSLQIETGFVMENAETAREKIKSYAYNTTLLRYGLLESMELRLGLEYLNEEIAIKNTDTVNTFSGTSPLYAGFKIKIADEAGWMPEIAFLGGLELPFTAAEHFETSSAAAGMRFSIAHTLSDRFSIGYNLGAEWDGETAAPSYYYSLALGIGITDRLGMFIENYGLLSENGGGEHLFDAGITYLVLPNLQFDISGGFGLNDEAIDNFISCGLSYRIPR